jgi:hypothetical protein
MSKHYKHSGLLSAHLNGLIRYLLPLVNAAPGSPAYGLAEIRIILVIKRSLPVQLPDLPSRLSDKDSPRLEAFLAGPGALQSFTFRYTPPFWKGGNRGPDRSRHNREKVGLGFGARGRASSR